MCVCIMQAIRLISESSLRMGHQAEGTWGLNMVVMFRLKTSSKHWAQHALSLKLSLLTSEKRLSSGAPALRVCSTTSFPNLHSQLEPAATMDTSHIPPLPTHTVFPPPFLPLHPSRPQDRTPPSSVPAIPSHTGTCSTKACWVGRSRWEKQNPP